MFISQLREAVVEQIANNLEADIFEIVPVDEYTSDDLDWTDDDSRVSREHEEESLRDIELVSMEVPNWDEYDTIIIGYPIWCGKTVISFCTSSYLA